MYDNIINEAGHLINNHFGLIILNQHPNKERRGLVKKKYMIFILIFLVFLTGCDFVAQSSKSSTIPKPEQGKAIIHGIILSEDKVPLPDTVVRLAKVYHAADDDNGTFILDEANSPSTISEADGEFIFLNIDPGEYVLFVGQFHNEYMIVSDSEKNPNVYEVEQGEVLEIEPIIVVFD